MNLLHPSLSKHRLTLQAYTMYLYTHVLLALTVGFQVFSPSPTYIPDSICGRVLIRPPLGDGKYGLIRGVASREGYIRLDYTRFVLRNVGFIISRVKGSNIYIYI